MIPIDEKIDILEHRCHVLTGNRWCKLCEIEDCQYKHHENDGQVIYEERGYDK